jgi:hypothetical protein
MPLNHLMAGLSGKVGDNRHSSVATFREMGGPVKKKSGGVHGPGAYSSL